LPPDPLVELQELRGSDVEPSAAFAPGLKEPRINEKAQIAGCDLVGYVRVSPVAHVSNPKAERRVE